MPYSQIPNIKSSPDIQNTALAPLAAAISFALAASVVSTTAHAQEATPARQSEPRQLSKLVAKDSEEEIKVDTVSSPKFTQPLLDTPQTVTVVPQVILSQQGAGTLVEALANTPGITMQLGENGNTSAGDTFSIRGSASQTNVFIDGIRDTGPVSRDIFNTQQVEIAKGAVGADFGRGTTAGYINMVSKLPQTDDFGAASFSVNTGVSVRATSDLNKQISDNSALRFNAVWQDGDVVGRDFVENNRWGVAPSLAFGLNTATRLYFYSLHTRGDNVPDGGIPSIGMPGFFNATLAAAGISPAAVDRENFYGRYDDYEETKSDTATLRLEHDFSDTFKLVNSTRYGKHEMERVLTGINALTVSATTPPDTWTVARTRQSVTQENTLLTNQTNLKFSFNTGGLEHDLASGVEFIREEQYSPTFTGIGTLPNANLYNPNAYDDYTVAYERARTAAYSDGQTVSYAAYIFDTLKFNDAWLFSAGARLDHYETDFNGVVVSTATSYPTLPVGTLVPLDLSDSGDLLSWKLGVVFKPTSIGSIYLAYSNSSQPPGGANFVLSDPNAANNTTNINRPGLDPQEATNIELGTKWDLLDARLALSLAVYRTDNRNEVSITDSVTSEVSAYGKRRVQGAEFGVVGKLTDSWSVIAGVAWSDNEVISGSTGNNAAGAAARWAPEYSANLWSTYAIGKWTGGVGLNFVDEQKRVVDPSLPVSTQAGVPAIPGYTVFNGMLGYQVTDSLGLQLNVNNLFDRDYISSLNNGGARLTLGAPRNAQLTANFKF